MCHRTQLLILSELQYCIYTTKSRRQKQNYRYQKTPHLIRRMRRLLEDYEKKYKLDLSKTATQGTEESGHCKEVAVVERFQTRANLRIFCPSEQKISGRCRKVAISEGSTVPSTESLGNLTIQTRVSISAKKARHWNFNTSVSFR